MKRLLSLILCIVVFMSFVFTASALKSIPVKSIKLDTSSITLEVGKFYNLKVTFTPAKTTQKRLKFSTSDKNVATVDVKGKITAVKAGKATISVISASNKKVIAICNVNVIKKEVLNPTYKKVSLKCLGGATASGPAAGWYNKYLEEKIGVNLEFLPDSPERRQASLASGELPDLVYLKWDELDTAIKGKLVVNLDEHKDELKNIYSNKAVCNALQFVRDEHSSGTGNAYSVPTYIGKYNMPIDTGSYAANVRWDIYRAIGAPKVNTLEDFLPVLKKMQDYYPKTKDGQKVYAISIFPEWDGGKFFYHAASLYHISGYFQGLSKYFLSWNIKDNKTEELLDPEGMYVRALKFYYNANQMGILDPDSLTQTYVSAKAKMTSGACLTAWNWSGGLEFNTPDNTNSDPPKGFRPVIFKDYYASTMGDYPVGGGGNAGCLAIGSSTEHLDAGLRYLNLLSDTNALLTINNGPQGFLWDIGKDGKPYVTDQYWKYVNDTKMELPGGGRIIWTNPIIREDETHPTYDVAYSLGYLPEVIKKQTENKLYKDWTSFYGYETPIKLIKAQNRLFKRPLANSFLSLPGNDIETIRKQIGDIVATNSWLMVFAKNQQEFDAYYNDMVKKAEGLGISKVMDWAKSDLAKAIKKAKKYE